MTGVTLHTGLQVSEAEVDGGARQLAEDPLQVHRQVLCHPTLLQGSGIGVETLGFGIQG